MLHLLAPSALVFTLVTCAYFLRSKYSRASRKSPPIIFSHWFSEHRNILQVPYRAQLFVDIFAPQYGDIVQISTPLKTVITLNSLRAVTEVLEKQARETSDRPQDIMVSELLGRDILVSHRNNDETHRKHRRVMTSALSQSAARSYSGLHVSTIAFFLQKLMRQIQSASTKDICSVLLVSAIHDSLGRFTMRMAYGYVALENDPALAMIKQQAKLFSAARFQNYWVNVIPILRYVPSWLPGAGFKRHAQAFRDNYAMISEATFRPLLEQMHRGGAQRVSYASKVLAVQGESSQTIEMTQFTSHSLFLAGTATTTALIHSFMFMMSIHPDVATRVQTEIDAQVGRDRLPTLEDREALPYTDAVLQEVVRYCPVIAFGIEHASSQDIQVRDYTIKKGTAIEANIWALMREPSTYPDPHSFNPDRFLGPEPDPDPRRFMFGFGRRACPGLHVANNSVFMMCTSFMSVFDIRAGEETMRRVKECGRDVWRMFREHRVFEPKPFRCAIKPRDQVAFRLLETCEDAQVID